MTRTRRITSDEILDAAERVVVRDGAVGLSIDAVAKEVGCSKSRVVYDHKSKQILLEALLDRRLRVEREQFHVARKKAADTPHPALFARIAMAAEALKEEDRAVALALCASMLGNTVLQDRIKQWTKFYLDEISQGERPRAALMAYLALQGFADNEYFGFHQWSDSERAEILDGIRTIYVTFPEH